VSASGVELELKCQVPAAARAAVLRAVATADAQRTRLRAVYADTPDHRLAAAGLALRLRREGRRWVQTLKGRGDGVLQRLEHEVELPPQRGVPAIDPARHTGSAAGVALMRVLGDAVLGPLYRTDIQRTHRRVSRGGTTIEIAFDEGRIVAGRHTLPVCEIEFELIAGAPAELVALAERWLRRHRLWLDVRTKSERGFRLALSMPAVDAVRAAAMPPFGAAAHGGDAFAAMLHGALAQCLPNAAELAAGSGRAEHVHQLRVGLRRLRTALRLFGHWSADPAAAAALERALREPFTRLGAARDADVLRETFWPTLEAVGAPPLAAAPPLPHEDPGAVVRAPAFGALLLQALRLALCTPAEPVPLREAAHRVLRAAHRRLVADAAGFAAAEHAAQHRTRKRLKRLRYATEFLQPLLPARPARRALAVMRVALDDIGAYTDLLLAQLHFRALAEHDTAAWFALGWLAAQSEPRLRRAAKGLQRVAALPKYWP
jgi:inorganic triphosphatase YgiF